MRKNGRMDSFQWSVENKWDTRTSTIELQPDDQQNVPLLQNDDDEFMEGFGRVIKAKDLPKVDVGDDVEDTRSNQWVNVEVGVNTEGQDLRHAGEKSSKQEPSTRQANSLGLPMMTFHWTAKLVKSNLQTVRQKC